MALLPVSDALERLLALAAPFPVERVPVDEALGRYLAEPMLARRTQPAADISAMDGYAVRAADLPGEWSVVGESAAGHPFAGTVGAGEAVRISTGAHVPAGADTVLVQEDCTRDGQMLLLTGDGPDSAGRHIRRAGNDFTEGAPLLDAGARVTPARLALALAAGHSHLAVRRKPKIAVIDSGDELSPDPGLCASHQIPASNGAMIAALVASALPCAVQRHDPVPDTVECLVAALDTAQGCDVIVTSGGASVGDHDLLQPALARWGATVDFWKVAMKPGKPLLIARKGSQTVVGLPGNPVSSMVTAYLFLLPLLRALLGADAPSPQAVPAALLHDLPGGGPRQEFLRGWWDGQSVTARVNQDSGALAALAHSNCLIERGANAPAAQAGTVVPVYLLENGGIA